MIGELPIQSFLYKTVQSISTPMYYVLSTKIQQGADAVIGTVLQKKCYKICR